MPIGGAGFGFPDELKDENEADEFGLSVCDRKLFRKAATPGAGGAPGGRGGAEPGIRGGAPFGFNPDPPIGGRGAELRVVSGSDWYGDSSVSLPVATPPPVFLNLGIPPANIPPSCGAEAMAAPPVSLPSLLLLARFPPGGGGGAKPPGADGLFAIPGTGGAPMAGAAGADIFVSIIGADLSFTTVFFNRAPPSILLSKAPYEHPS